MAIDKEKDLVSGLGELIAPSTAGDTASMLKAIQNAALIRAGIGIMGQRQMGESGYDVASRVLKDVSTDAATQITNLQKLATTKAKTKSDAQSKALTDYSKVQSIYDKTFYVKDSLTGDKTGLRLDFQGVDNLEPPSQEWFKNNIATQDMLLGDTGEADAYIKFHKDMQEAANEGRLSGIKPGTKLDWNITKQEYDKRILTQGL
tara:strand:+ start:2186 stop:2797 length:612 start_codon:yes stop_codon:yes gene_type:complete